MPWLPSAAEIARAACDSLFVHGCGYTVRPDGDLDFETARPGPGWHRNDMRPKRQVVVGKGRVRRVIVWRRRWRLAGTTETRQDRAPDELGAVHVCSLVMVLKLYAWLSSTRGLHHYEEVLPSLESYGSRRSVQRWMRRATPLALGTQQALRDAVIERSGSRPIEQLFPSGLSPPEALLRRHWLDPAAVTTLWRGLALLLGGAFRLDVAVSVLLAEARGRRPDPTFHFLI